MYKQIKELIRHSIVYGIGNIASRLVGFFLLPLYTRFLIPADYGLLEAVSMVVAIGMPLLMCGMDSALVRFYFDVNQVEERSKIVANVALFLVVLSTLCVSLLFINVRFITLFLFHDIKFTYFLKIIFLQLWFGVNLVVPMMLLRVKGESKRYSIYSFICILLNILLSVVFVVFLKRGVKGVILAGLFSSCLTYLILIRYIFKNIVLKFSLHLIKDMLKYSLPLVPAGLGAYILAITDRYFLLKYASLNELGLYGVGFKFVQIVVLINLAFQLAWGPFALSIAKQENAKQIYSKVLTYFVLVNLLLIMGLSLFVDQILRVMTTPAYYSASSIVPILSFGAVFYSSYYIFSIGASIIKKTKFFPIITGIPAILNIILDYLWVPRYGMLGAGVATALSYFIMAFLMWLVSHMYYPVPYEWARIAKMALICALLLLVNSQLHIENTLISILVKVVLLVAYMPMLFLLRFFNSEEIDKLTAFHRFLCRRFLLSTTS